MVDEGVSADGDRQPAYQEYLRKLGSVSIIYRVKTSVTFETGCGSMQRVATKCNRHDAPSLVEVR